MFYDLDNSVRATMFGKVYKESGAWHKGYTPKEDIVLYLIDGKTTMMLDNEVYLVEKGDLLIIPKGVFYKPLEGGFCRFYFFHFDAKSFKCYNKLTYETAISPHAGLKDGYAYTCSNNYSSIIEVPIFIKHTSYSIKSVFERAEELHPNASIKDQLLLNELVRELLILMGSTNSQQKSTHLIKILDYIEQNYNEDISLSALAKKFSLSQSYIARLFREELYCRPSEYVNRVRTSIAQTILTQSNLTIGEVCEKVGYNDVYYFSKTFKKYVGYPPSSIRK